MWGAAGTLNALCVAVAAAQAVERVGMPEAQIILAHAVTYVASAPKSNASCVAIDEAMQYVENTQDTACSVSFTGCTL